MIYFMLCADEAVGRAECSRRGWTQVGADRFYTPQRDDIRLARRFTDIMLLPGGTWFIPGPDFPLNPEARRFLHLIRTGAAKWVEGEDPTKPTITAGQPPPEVQLPQTPPAEAPPLCSQSDPATPRMPPSTRDNWPPRTTESTGARRGRPPLHR